ncbi:MAG: hypothetical protein JWN96_837, partial [Mycobacterium sp.]|nr:hypothetical protein [Mycobacterium sp.]
GVEELRVVAGVDTGARGREAQGVEVPADIDRWLSNGAGTSGHCFQENHTRPCEETCQYRSLHRGPPEPYSEAAGGQDGTGQALVCENPENGME